MKVILLEDVKALGKKGQVVEVSDGYAKNFILKKKLGLEATGANMNDLKLQKARDEKVAQQQLDAAKEQAALLEEKSVTRSIKAGEGGKAFGSVSSKEIAAAYKEQCNMEIDKKKIQLPESIKTFGMHEVPVKLHPQVTGKLHVKVVEAERQGIRLKNKIFQLRDLCLRALDTNLTCVKSVRRNERKTWQQQMRRF